MRSLVFGVLMGLLRRTTSGLKLNVNLRMHLSTVTTYSEQSDDEL